MTQQEYEHAMLEAFINKPEKTAWYEAAFSKYNVNGIDTMQWVWSWWAFFGGWAFLLYRKQYLAAFILFIITLAASVIPFGGLIVSILAGGYATYFIYKGYKTKKIQIEEKIPDIEQRIETMRAVGGYNQWVVWLYALFVTLFFIYIISLVVAMTVPGYSSY